ncbi:MAG: hypothetical protein QXI12_07420 [Candidatus Methanomethyliaceae archaeon]
MKAECPEFCYDGGQPENVASRIGAILAGTGSISTMTTVVVTCTKAGLTSKPCGLWRGSGHYQHMRRGG